MTTTNTEVQTAETRTNIKVAIISGNVAAVTQYFADYAGDADTFKTLKATITEALKGVPAEFKARAVRLEQAKENRIAGIKAAKQKRDEARQELEVERSKEAEKMLQHLMDEVNGLGLDIEAATVAVDAAMVKKYGKVKKEVQPMERATVSVNGVQYEVPRNGNTSKEVKALMQAEGLDRDAFIAKYEVKAEA